MYLELSVSYGGMVNLCSESSERMNNQIYKRNTIVGTAWKGFIHLGSSQQQQARTYETLGEKQASHGQRKGNLRYEIIINSSDTKPEVGRLNHRILLPGCYLSFIFIQNGFEIILNS